MLSKSLLSGLSGSAQPDPDGQFASVHSEKFNDPLDSSAPNDSDTFETRRRNGVWRRLRRQCLDGTLPMELGDVRRGISRNADAQTVRWERHVRTSFGRINIGSMRLIMAMFAIIRAKTAEAMKTRRGPNGRDGSHPFIADTHAPECSVGLGILLDLKESHP
jgi:hypothetical protein